MNQQENIQLLQDVEDDIWGSPVKIDLLKAIMLVPQILSHQS